MASFDLGYDTSMKCNGALLWTTATALLVICGEATVSAQQAPAPDAEGPADLDRETDPGADESGAGGAVEAEEAELEKPAEGASDAKRLVRIRRVIELDKERLDWLRAELRERTRWFEDLAAGMQELNADRTEKEAKIEALEANPRANAEELQELRRELAEDQEDFGLFETQTDLALKAEKTIRAQIEALEDKIQQERVALGRLTGNLRVEVGPAETDAAQDADATPAEEAPEAKTLPTRIPISAMPRTRPTSEPTEAKTSSGMTAAQLEAKEVLLQREREVETVSLELAEFVERKQSLEQQIKFEEELAATDRREVENLRKALDAMEARLEKYRERGLPEKKIRARANANQNILTFIEEAERGQAARAEYIDSLETRLEHLEESQLRITAEVDAAVEAAADAQQKVKWLESPIHPENVAHWVKERGPRMLLVIIAAVLLLAFVHLSARRIARAVVRRRREDARGAGTGRADTLAFSFRSVSRVLIVIFGTLLVLQEAGVDIKTVLGGAAILGVAVAFGAQDLMKDYFSGFLILLEDQYQLGDLVTISGVTGTVESVNMRVTVLRDLEGRVHFMPNGNIDHVTNRTYAWGRPVFEIPVDFDEDVDRVMELLVEVAKELSDDPDWRGSIIGEPEMLGVDKFTEYGAVIKFMVKTEPDKLFPVRRQMFRRIMKRFNEVGIRITVPQRLIARDGPSGDLL